MEHIDVIFYINLEHRTDRRENIEKELTYLVNNTNKIIRFQAIYNKDVGALGCAKSHLEILEKFRDTTEWNTCLIFEDDFSFFNKNIEHNNSVLRTIINNCPNWDAISLMYNPIQGFFFEKLAPPLQEKIIVDNKEYNIVKVLTHQMTSGYLLKKGEYVDELIKIFKKCIKGLEKVKLDTQFLNIDQAWKIIQDKINWYTTIPSIGKNIDGYSDICKSDIVYDYW